MVDCVHHELSRDHTTSEVATVETADGILTTLDAIELDVNLTVVVVECEADVDNVAVLVFALLAYVVFELRLPVWLGLPMILSVF